MYGVVIVIPKSAGKVVPRINLQSAKLSKDGILYLIGQSVLKKMGRGVPVFRDLFNADLGLQTVSPRVTWTLESRLLRALRPAKPLFDPSYNANVNRNIAAGLNVNATNHTARAHIIDIISSADHALCATAASNGYISVHEPSDLEFGGNDTWRLSLRCPGASCAAWGNSSKADSVYVALPHRPCLWRFDLEACSEDKPSQELQFPPINGIGNNSGNNKKVFISDMVTIAPHVLAATTSEGYAIVLDERQKRCAVGGMRVSQHTSTSSRPPPITGTDPFIIVGTQGLIAMYDIRKFPAVSYTAKSSMSASATTHTFGAAKPRNTPKPAPGFLRGAYTHVRVLDRAGDFDSVHVAPGSRTTVAFQLSSGHVGISDLLRQGTDGVRVKVESAVPKRIVATAGRTGYASVEGELVEYGATMRSAADIWWVTRRRASLLSPDGNSNGNGWRFFAPLVHRAGFRVLALHPDHRTEVVGVKTGGKSVSCVKALYAPGGAPAVAVGYTHMHAELYEPRIRDEVEVPTAALR